MIYDLYSVAFSGSWDRGLHAAEALVHSSIAEASVLAVALTEGATKGGAIAGGTIDETQVGYYHWGFPNATHMAPGQRKHQVARATFTLLSPKGRQGTTFP